MKPKVALAIGFNNPPQLWETLNNHFEVIDITSNQQVDNASEIQALITSSHAGVPDWVWEDSGVKIISNFGVGYDGIDTERAATNGIWVANTPTVLNDAVAETTFGIMLMLVRELPQAMQHLTEGKWLEGEYPLTESLEKKHLGLLGMGGIGTEIAKRAATFKMEISYHCRTPKDVSWTYESSLLELAKKCDILCAIVPGGAETKHLINAEVLEALGPKGFLVNVARGSVVDQDALIKAIEQEKIAGAALDVFADEPNVPQELIDFENVVCVPHIGSATKITRRAMGQLVIDNIVCVLDDKEPFTPVNKPQAKS